MSSPAEVAAPVIATPTGFVAFTPAHPGDWKTAPVCDPLLWFSADGSRWQLTSTVSPFGAGAFVGDVAERNGRYVAVGGLDVDHGAVWTSDDGLRWTRAGLPAATGRTVNPGTLDAGALGWIITGRQVVTGTEQWGDVMWISTDGRNWEGPYPLPAGLGSGYVPTQLAIATDAVFGVGGRNFTPVIGRRAG